MISPIILIVDDDSSVRETFRSILKNKHETLTASDGNAALEMLKSRPIDIVFLDLMLPDVSGLHLLALIKKFYPATDVIIVTVVAEISTIVTAIKMGAFDYISKEIDPVKILHIVEIIKNKKHKENELLYLKDELSTYTNKELIFGKTVKMYKISELVNKVKDLPTTVLIQGETGTGKELIAREIQKSSKYRNFPFVSVNLAALPKELIESILFGHEKGAFTNAIKQTIGKFELADNGILFMDEIGELEYSLQSKLLRVIQEGEIERLGSNKQIKINVRLIAATSRDLEKMVEKGTFRKDLFFRLNVVPIKLPPLRERTEDIPSLVNLFICRYNKKFGKSLRGMDNESVNILRSYDWPGNIRELENLIERIVAVSDDDFIHDSDIPLDYFFKSMSRKLQENDLVHAKDFFNKSLESFERSMLKKCLETNNYDRKKTASMLGLPLSTLKFKIKKLVLGPSKRRFDKDMESPHEMV